MSRFSYIKSSSPAYKHDGAGLYIRQNTGRLMNLRYVEIEGINDDLDIAVYIDRALDIKDNMPSKVVRSYGIFKYCCAKVSESNTYNNDDVLAKAVKALFAWSNSISDLDRANWDQLNGFNDDE